MPEEFNFERENNPELKRLQKVAEDFAWDDKNTLPTEADVIKILDSQEKFNSKFYKKV